MSKKKLALLGIITIVVIIFWLISIEDWNMVEIKSTEKVYSNGILKYKNLQIGVSGILENENHNYDCYIYPLVVKDDGDEIYYPSILIEGGEEFQFDKFHVEVSEISHYYIIFDIYEKK